MPVTTIETAQYSTVQMIREPMMPIGRSRCGFLVSSAVVATTSNPMNAKNTSAAPAKIPPMPNAVGASPNSAWMSGCVRPVVVSFASAGGTNGW